jgi:hypothetical protein
MELTLADSPEHLCPKGVGQVLDSEGMSQWKYNGRGELVQGTCTHVWNYHNEISLYY